jgi:hypothetical protein
MEKPDIHNDEGCRAKPELEHQDLREQNQISQSDSGKRSQDVGA